MHAMNYLTSALHSSNGTNGSSNFHLTGLRGQSRETLASVSPTQRASQDSVTSMFQQILHAVQETRGAIREEQALIQSALDAFLDKKLVDDPRQQFPAREDSKTSQTKVSFYASSENPPKNSIDDSHKVLQSVSSEFMPIELEASATSVKTVTISPRRSMVEVGTGSCSTWVYDEANWEKNGTNSSEVQVPVVSLFSSHHSSKYIRDSVTSISSFDKAVMLIKSGRISIALTSFVASPSFDFMMGFVIVCNSIYIGFQINDSIGSDRADDEPSLPDYVFLTIYIIEFLARCRALGLKLTLENNWNKLDLVLITIGSFSLFIITPIKLGGQGAEVLQHMSILRLLRLLRLVRSLRLLAQFAILWRLVNGLLHALGAIVSTMTLLCLLIYICACFGVEIITKSNGINSAAESDPTLRNILDLYFPSLPMVMMTLIRFTTMDSIGVIYEPLVRENSWLIVYFVFILLVVSITIMNLITAVLVEHSIYIAKIDNELSAHLKKKRVRNLVPKIEELFERLDSNGDGLLTLDEAISAEVVLPIEFANIVSRDGLFDLFEALDGDHSGYVDKKEFIDGVIDLAMSDVPIEFLKVLHYCRLQKEQLRKVTKDIRQLRFAHGLVDASHGSHISSTPVCEYSASVGDKQNLNAFKLLRQRSLLSSLVRELLEETGICGNCGRAVDKEHNAGNDTLFEKWERRLLQKQGILFL